MAFNPMPMRWNKLYKGTPAELALEPAIAALGVPYRTQFPGFLYGFRFFPDFYLPTLGLVIEVDDSSHTRLEKRIEDGERTEVLESKGWKVVRCTNAEAMGDPSGTVHRLMLEAGMWPLPARQPTMVEALPKPAKAPKKEVRAAKSASRQRRRSRA